LALAVLALGLLVAPRLYHNYDVVDCFLAWARASGGARPWDVYRPHVAPDDCDYPPLVPYLLTLAEAARRFARAPAVGALSVVLVKLPGLLALAGAAPLLWLSLRGPWGDHRARLAAVLFATSPALFVNAAAWGQFDVLVALFVALALAALVQERTPWAGVATGLALATKLLGIVPVPLFAVWVARRQGLRSLAGGLGAALLVIVLLALPHVAGGAGPAVAKSYVGAVNYYPYRTGEAYNSWYLLDRHDMDVRGIPGPVARRDDRPVIRGVTFRHLGLAAFAAYSLFVMTLVWRRPSAHVLLWATGMELFAFFMLPTQVHQRYVVAAVAVLALVAPLSTRGLLLFVGVSLTATLNQGLDLLRALPWSSPLEGALLRPEVPLSTHAIKDAAAVVSAFNVALFFWATTAFWREAGAAPAEPRSDSTPARTAAAACGRS
jgi:hypothetical protein